MIQYSVDKVTKIGHMTRTNDKTRIICEDAAAKMRLGSPSAAAAELYTV